VRRLADAGPFDVAGDNVLLTRGMSVYEVPAAGGEPVLRYTVPSLAGSSVTIDPASEAITMIEAAPDGSAVVASLVPVLNADGQKVGATGGTALVDPTGAIRSRDLNGMVEWSDDGSLLAVADYRGLRALRPDGAVAWGPVAMGTPTPNRLTWAADNGSLAWEVDAHRLVRYDIASGGLQEIPALWRHIDFGPDGRAIGQRLPPPDWTGFTHPGVAVWDPATGAATPFTPGGYDAVWSPGGSKVWMLDAPLSGGDDGSHFSIRIYDAGAGRIMAVGLRGGLSFGREINDPRGGPPIPGWAAGDRHLVVEVHAGLP
jgi:hypothetical protein